MYEGGDGGPDKVTLLHTTCGTPNYVAPEVLADRGYDGYMADTWSIGVILFVFLAGYLPFDEPTMSALFRKISNADFSYPSWFEDDVKDLLDKILVADPKKRLSLMEITRHPWFTKGGTYFMKSRIFLHTFCALTNVLMLFIRCRPIVRSRAHPSRDGRSQ